MGLKRLLWAFFALTLSASVFADEYSDDEVLDASADNCVMVPMQQGGFKIGLDALYLRPTNSDLDYAAVVSFPSNFTAGFERNIAADPTYDWGLYAQIGYLISCTGNDITLGYTYLHNNESNSLAVADPLGAEGPVIGVLPLGFREVRGESSFDLNVADLDVGQRFTTGSYDLRMFVGVRYANVNHELKIFASPFTSGIAGTNTTTAGFYEYKNELNGVGPRLGVDARYCLSNGFGIDANISTALLVGSVDSSLFFRRSFALLPPFITNFGVKNNSKTHIVPVLEAKLGLDYAYVSDSQCKSSWVFEAGYQVTNYFNVVHRPRVLETALPVGSSFVLQNRTSDIAFDGPYLGVKYYA